MEEKLLLEDCEPGDILISKHGNLYEFIKHLPEDEYYDCVVQVIFLNGDYMGNTIGPGTRLLDGRVYKNNRMHSDDDIIKVIPKKEFNKLKGSV